MPPLAMAENCTQDLAAQHNMPAVKTCAASPSGNAVHTATLLLCASMLHTVQWSGTAVRASRPPAAHRPERHKRIPGQCKQACPDVAAPQSLRGYVNVQLASCVLQLNPAACWPADRTCWHGGRSADTSNAATQTTVSHGLRRVPTADYSTLDTRRCLQPLPKPVLRRNPIPPRKRHKQWVTFNFPPTCTSCHQGAAP
jgi:hypothetical protein